MKELALFDGKGMKVNADGMVSLTDIWNANGGESRNRPKAWLETQQAQDFVAEVVKGQDSALFLKVAKGRNGGTFAHWQIALAYSQFLSPELHVAVNTVFKGFMEADASVATSVLERTKDQQAVERIALKAIDKTEDPEALRRQEMRARSKFANKSVNAEIAARGGTQKTYARVANMNNLSITGMKASEFREARNLPKSASTREHLTLEQMAIMSFQELAESAALRKSNVFGSESIVNNVASTINDVQALVRRVGMVPA